MSYAKTLAERQNDFKGQTLTGKVGYSSPSNIALVKYWGKLAGQIPCNPSISFTLEDARTDTEVTYEPSASGKLEVVFHLDGVVNESFGARVEKYLTSILEFVPFLENLKLTIHSSNTFPHSTGIASSASGMSALALCLCQMEMEHFDSLQDEQEFLKKASFLARLGSGSACRSVYGAYTQWGASDLEGSSDEFAVQLHDIHPDFTEFHDSILLVDRQEKKVSSSIGHGLMNANPYAEARFASAKERVERMRRILATGEMEDFLNLCESEALTLHAMMMASNPHYMLMRPGTVAAIEEIMAFRKDTGLPVSFTLDAGPNIHLLYAKSAKESVSQLIERTLIPHLQDGAYIEDHVGQGPRVYETAI